MNSPVASIHPGAVAFAHHKVNAATIALESI